MDFEVVGVRICRMDGGMVDNIMMASAGQGGAGLRGDQYYPPPPPPPRFPPPFPSPHGIPTRSLPRSSSFLLPSTTIAVSTLQPSTFSPFYRRPSFASSSFSTSPVLRIELLGRRDAPRLRSIPSYVCLCVCVCVCVCMRKRTWRVHMWPRTRGIVYRDTRYKRFVDRELCTMLFFVAFWQRFEMCWM